METKSFLQESGGAVSRRKVLIGAAAAALSASVPSALAASKTAATPNPIVLSSENLAAELPIQRYMAASVCLPDGRVLITGGFNRPANEDSKPTALSSALILEPYSGDCTVVAPMNVPRARHAAVLLRNGLVVVIGGISQGPLASIEVYDPARNEWSMLDPLEQPRYDHSVAFDGTNIFVVGGSSHTMLSNIEVIRMGASTQSQRP